MAIRRRLTALFGVPIVLAAGLALNPVVAHAQFKPAGNYANTGMLGSFNYDDPDTGTNISFFANRQITVGPAGTTDQTSIFLNASVNFGALNVNCFLNETSANFNVAPDVSSATFDELIPQAEPGCGGNLPSDTQVDIAWTGAGPIQSTNTTSLFMCSGYTDVSHGTDSNNAGPATFNMTGLGGPVTAPFSASDSLPVFHFGSSNEHVQGAVPPETCSGSVGRGAGRATPAAGNYLTTLKEADEFSFSNGFVFIDASANTSTSNPLVGPSTSTASTSLILSTPSIGGCFLIDPSNLTFTSSSASVQTSLTGSTPACGGGTNFVDPDPFPVSIGWVATVPVATTRITSQYSCLAYRFQTSTVQTFAGAANVTATMPGFSATFTDGAFGSIQTRTHADGTPAAGCFFRG